jgi:hypothetical protein
MFGNSADDFINPPELGIAEREIKRVKNGKFVLIPISDQTHGHGTHTWAAVWQQYLRELLETSQRRRVRTDSLAGRLDGSTSGPSGSYAAMRRNRNRMPKIKLLFFLALFFPAFAAGQGAVIPPRVAWNTVSNPFFADGHGNNGHTDTGTLSNWDHVFFVDGVVYTTIQAAIKAAGATGAVVIPSSYAGTDTYINPNGIAIIDLRIANGANEFRLFSVIAPSFPVANFPEGNDLVLRSRGPADTYIEKLKVAGTTKATLSVGTNTDILVSAFTVSDVPHGTLQTGTTALLSPSSAGVPLIAGRQTANEEVISSENWSIVDATHITITCAKSHSGTTDIEQLGSTLLTAYDLYVDSAGLNPSQLSGFNAPLRLKDSTGAIIAYVPTNIGDIYPYGGWQWNVVQIGSNGAAGNLFFQPGTSSGRVFVRNASGSTNLFYVDDNGNVTFIGHLNTGAANGDVSGSISSASGTTVSKTFAVPYASTPTIVVTPTTNAGAFYLSAVSASAFTITYATSGAQTFNYHVVGNPN